MDLGEWLGEIGLGDGLVADIKRLEEGLVDEPAYGVVPAQVEVVEVFADDFQREVECCEGIVEVEAYADDEILGVLASAAQAGLLFVEEFAADAVFVMHRQELALLLFDFLEDAPAAINLLLGCRDALAEADRDGLADVLAFGLAERHRRVVVLDRGLYEVDGLVALWALAALVARANEVVVVAAVAFVAGVDETAAAGAAADGALEVVLVLAVALAGEPVRFQDGLNLVEQVLANERLVPSGVLFAAVGDDAGVVGAGEHVVDAVEAQWLRRANASPAREQAASLKQGDHVDEAVEAGGVGLERPADDGATDGVDDDRADLAALGELFADVQIAQPCASRRAAALGLLDRSLEHLVGEVAAVVLGEACEHSVHQPAGWGLIDVLRGADQPCTGQLDLEQHVGVVAAVAGEPIDLPEDHVVDVALLFDAREHGVQCGPLVGLG